MNLTMKPVHVTFPSIEQFRNTCHDVKHFAKMAQKPLPKITFEGTVKLHGTNSGISAYNSHTDPENFWCQSRNQILTVTNDNYGFAKFVDSQKEAVASLLKSFADKLETLLPNRVFILNIFGEWAGSGVQQGVGVSQLPKMFVVFAVGVQDTETENVDTNHRKWVWLKREDIQDVMHNYNLTNFKSIYDFQTWTHEVDFLNPKISQNYFAELTLAVEKECPVAKKFLDYVLYNNTAFEDESGKIWFEKENNFTEIIKTKIDNFLKEKRKDYPKGVNYIKFNFG